MADVVLEDRQFDLDGYVFGNRAPSGVRVENLDFGSPEPRTNDVDRPRGDGVIFAREYRSGREITFELFTMHKNADVLDALGEFASAWDAAAVRSQTRAMSVLRYNLDGVTRRVWGRPRRIEADTAHYRQGRVLITAVFATEGPLSFADAPVEQGLSLVPGTIGGFTFPLTFPATTVGMGERKVGLEIPGYSAAPLIITIQGPIANPVIAVDGHWEFQLLTSLAHDETVQINTFPWMNTIRTNRNSNLAGAVSIQSPRMPDMWLPPGVYDITLRGTDPTGTATAVVQAWTTRPSL